MDINLSDFHANFLLLNDKNFYLSKGEPWTLIDVTDRVKE